MTDEILDPDLEPIEKGSALDTAFSVAEDWPEDLAALYLDNVNTMRNEARGLPMGRVQLLLIERMNRFYIEMKVKERTGEFSVRELKDMLAFWLSMTVEFNKQLAASNDKAKTAILLEVKNVLQQSLKLVSDTEERKALARTWGEEFAKMDL